MDLRAEVEAALNEAINYVNADGRSTFDWLPRSGPGAVGVPCVMRAISYAPLQAEDGGILNPSATKILFSKSDLDALPKRGDRVSFNGLTATVESCEDNDLGNSATITTQVDLGSNNRRANFRV